MSCSTGANGQHTSEVLQQLDLTQRALGEDLLAEDVGHLLDGHALACLVVGSRAAGTSSASGRRLAASRLVSSRLLPDNAVCTLPELLGDIVALVDDELLVEHLEHFAPCEV